MIHIEKEISCLLYECRGAHAQQPHWPETRQGQTWRVDITDVPKQLRPVGDVKGYAQRHVFLLGPAYVQMFLTDGPQPPLLVRHGSMAGQSKSMMICKDTTDKQTVTLKTIAVRRAEVGNALAAVRAGTSRGARRIATTNTRLNFTNIDGCQGRYITVERATKRQAKPLHVGPL